MKVDANRGYLYSIANDKRLNVIDLNNKNLLINIKTSNARFKAL